ncbi:MAG: sulfate adenylyltransferase [Halanaerobiales bacterium]
MIEPHGGELVDRDVKGEKKQEILARVEKMPRLELDFDELNTVNNIATGLFSPLEGFMNEADYTGVVEDMHLTDGTVWTIPVVLGVSGEEAKELKEGRDVALYFEEDGEPYAVLHLEEKYGVDRKKEAKLVYGTTEGEHPGVAAVYDRDEVLLGGRVSLLRRLKYDNFCQYRLTPAETRQKITDKGWETVVAFQTRNPIHRAHEYLQKCALEMVDGLYISPLVGRTKASDIPAGIRIKSYEVVMEELYPQERTMLVVFPAAMHYAGPREAVFHALCRQNYGCSHFIVGRDHAGVGDYYGTYEAQEIFNEFEPGEIGITPLKFEYAFYCKRCGGMASEKTCPHSGDEHIFLSGTKVRELLRNGERPPAEMTRPVVSDVLIEGLAETDSSKKLFTE